MPETPRLPENHTPAAQSERSIVIAGGSMIGLSLALALRQGLGSEIPIVVADPALAVRPSRDERATAVIAAGRHLFETLGIWLEISGRAQPILEMKVTDSPLEDAMRPVFLTFGGEVAGSSERSGEPFAHMVENRDAIDALITQAEREGVDLRSCARPSRRGSCSFSNPVSPTSGFVSPT